MNPLKKKARGMIDEGRTNKEIAKALNITTYAVQNIRTEYEKEKAVISFLSF